MLKKLTLIILIPLFIFGLFKLNLFKIQKIEIRNDHASCATEGSLKERSALLNKNIFLIDEKKVQENLKKNFICIKNINFSKGLPNKIKMDVVARSAVAKVISIWKVVHSIKNARPAKYVSD